ncbi:MAG TPA: WYL domain-containing protein, partial [Acidimicrobiales bacterium]|nr:WYL domain-containing protein [Acidimicrobiales bacterium]
EGISIASFPFQARIRIPLPVEKATRLVPRTFAILEGTQDGTLVELGAPSLERMVAYLAGLSPSCEVLDPPELRKALVRHAKSVVDVNGPAS